MCTVTDSHQLNVTEIGDTGCLQHWTASTSPPARHLRTLGEKNLPMILEAAQLSQGKQTKTKTSGSIWTRPWQALMYAAAWRESMKTLEALSESGKGRRSQLCTHPTARREKENGRKQGCLVWLGACFSVFLLTLVNAGALQLLLLFYIALAFRSTDPQWKKPNPNQPTTGRKRISRERKSSSRNKYSCLK